MPCMYPFSRHLGYRHSKIKSVLMRLIFWECGKEDKKMLTAEEKCSRVRGWGEGMQPLDVLYRSVKVL